MRIDVLTLFPEIFDGFLGQSILKRAIQRGLVDVRRHNFRNFGAGPRHQVDDKPFGGGPGMLIMCPAVFDCVESVRSEVQPAGRLIMMTPQGRRLDQSMVEELAREQRLLILCGRYEGFDDRIRQGLSPTEISVGDFICNGGEVPAMLIIDAVIRLIPEVLGDATSSRYDSFSRSGLLEHPQFTRPREYRGMVVPEVLLSGDHQAVERWQQEESLKRTTERRSDLLTPPSRTDDGVGPESAGGFASGRTGNGSGV